MPQIFYKLRSSINYNVLEIDEQVNLKQLREIIRKKLQINVKYFNIDLSSDDGKAYADDDEIIKFGSKINVNRTVNTKKDSSKTVVQKSSVPEKISIIETKSPSIKPKVSRNNLPSESQVKDYMKCNKCCKLMVQATRITCCNKNFCYKCITGILYDPDVLGIYACPNCHTPIKNNQDPLVPNHQLQTIISNFKEGKETPPLKFTDTSDETIKPLDTSSDNRVNSNLPGESILDLLPNFSTSSDVLDNTSNKSPQSQNKSQSIENLTNSIKKLESDLQKYNPSQNSNEMNNNDNVVDNGSSKESDDESSDSSCDSSSTKTPNQSHNEQENLGECLGDMNNYPINTDELYNDDMTVNEVEIADESTTQLNTISDTICPDSERYYREGPTESLTAFAELPMAPASKIVDDQIEYKSQPINTGTEISQIENTVIIHENECKKPEVIIETNSQPYENSVETTEWLAQPKTTIKDLPFNPTTYMRFLHIAHSQFPDELAKVFNESEKFITNESMENTEKLNEENPLKRKRRDHSSNTGKSSRHYDSDSRSSRKSSKHPRHHSRGDSKHQISTLVSSSNSSRRYHNNYDPSKDNRGHKYFENPRRINNHSYNESIRGANKNFSSNVPFVTSSRRGDYIPSSKYEHRKHNNSSPLQNQDDLPYTNNHITSTSNSSMRKRINPNSYRNNSGIRYNSNDSNPNNEYREYTSRDKRPKYR